VKIGIVGLGYVGIQLAIVFARQYETIGFDLDEEKLAAYRLGRDPTGEVSRVELTSVTKLTFTSEPRELVGCDIYIVAVPTPVDKLNQPDFEPLTKASETVGRVLTSGAIVVYESTVYPGATEEICVPVLERVSGLKWKVDFHVGYSPERINPGDSAHTLQSIIKIVAGDNEETLNTISELYASIVTAGVHKASSIRVAEAAKVIENTQRDLNIALVNELALIFDQLGLDTTEVLEAAGTKWNFLPFTPGLVGGHCIGVDPYYLTHKAQMIGYEPQIILSGRRINDAMGIFVAEKTLTLMTEVGQGQRQSANVLGVTFKENCSDIRNSQVFTLIKHLQNSGVEVCIADPLADPVAVSKTHGVDLVPVDQLPPSMALIIAVPHQAFGSGEYLVRTILQKPGVFVDVKSTYRDAITNDADLTYWSL
tara:strand:+ start:1289 stop:2560 length:1272 start_codon:yes stop_codon:yes gene_type:complete